MATKPGAAAFKKLSEKFMLTPARIERPTRVPDGAGGYKTVYNAVVDLDCNVLDPSSREIQILGAGVPLIDARIRFPYATDIRARDRVTLLEEPGPPRYTVQTVTPSTAQMPTAVEARVSKLQEG